jgi:hypothetical protein
VVLVLLCVVLPGLALAQTVGTVSWEQKISSLNSGAANFGVSVEGLGDLDGDQVGSDRGDLSSRFAFVCFRDLPLLPLPFRSFLPFFC